MPIETKPAQTQIPTGTPAIFCDHVSKRFIEVDHEADAPQRRFGRLPRRVVHAVRDISFTVPVGETFGILGPNGSGKSTLIRLLSTLLVPDGGAVRIFGHDVAGSQTERMAIRRLINRVSVEASFFKKLSAMENLSYAARLYDVPIRQAREQVVHILTRLGLARGKLYTPLENLSRGMQQKVAIARALLTSPVLILLDEPTTGLDPKSKREVQDFIEEIRGTHNSTIILTTHDMQEAERLCNRVAIIEDGRFVALGTAEQLKSELPDTGKTPDLEDVFFHYTGRSWEAARDGDLA